MEKSEQEIQKNKIFKILPIFEGKLKDSEKLLNEVEAYNRFSIYLGKLIIEFEGWYVKEEDKPIYFNEILRILRGLQMVSVQELTHVNVKSCVMHCINLLK